MKEKELRLALVCYGGASLAVYMHGITKEILKLVRASAAFHAIPSLAERRTTAYQNASPVRSDSLDSELIYFDLFKMISEYMDLRVIVDIVAGASAGGINGVTLSRALAHDLNIESVTDAWLDEGDVEFMMADKVRAKAWSKAVLVPFISTFSKLRLEEIAPDQEMRKKISMFLRSRWFKPPFDGSIVSDMFFRAIDGMDEGREGNRSLIPPGQQLHLYVTVTDFFGHQQYLRLHDPDIVCEKEHRLVLQFDYGGRSTGNSSDFDRDHLPGLVFAARATSSYPGAFPPATIFEIEEMLRNKNRDWAGKQLFLDKNFAAYRWQGINPENSHFIDGGVLNNKPFSAAIGAIKNQIAFREVDRRLIYIDPDPDDNEFDVNTKTPKFIPTLVSSLSSLPRSQPIRDDLAFVGGYNDRIRRVKLMMESARPRIDMAVNAVAEEAADEGPDAVRQARQRAHRSVMAEVGLFYEGYLDLKIDSTVDYFLSLVTTCLGLKLESREYHRLVDLFRAWADAKGITKRERQGPAEQGSNPEWLRFLDHFDLGFRDRRIRFVVRSLNLLYPRLESEFKDVSAAGLNAVKRGLYEILDTLQPFRDGSFIDAETRADMEALVANLFNNSPEINFLGVDKIIGRLNGQMSLNQSCVAVEDLLCRQKAATSNRQIRQELLHAYIGYAYWDVLTFSITNWRNVGEFDEIRVDRISPLDATGIRGGGKRASLKGLGFEGFAGFFSRNVRENDYLWGRLHGVERLIDIVCSALPDQDNKVCRDRIEVLKTTAFRTIIQAERRQLTSIPAEFEQLDAELANRELSLSEKISL
ncbi:MAG: patatin-like protein [Sneathiella sp.]|nr:patatin-like protein [Sneathiella sp.]